MYAVSKRFKIPEFSPYFKFIFPNLTNYLIKQTWIPFLALFSAKSVFAAYNWWDWLTIKGRENTAKFPSINLSQQTVLLASLKIILKLPICVYILFFPDLQQQYIFYKEISVTALYFSIMEFAWNISRIP